MHDGITGDTTLSSGWTESSEDSLKQSIAHAATRIPLGADTEGSQNVCNKRGRDES